MALSNKSTTDVYLLFMVTPLWLLRYPGWLRCICHIAPTRCAARGVASFLYFVFAVSRREFVRQRQLAVECVRRILNRPSLLQLSAISMLVLYALMLYGVALYASQPRPFDSARAAPRTRARFADAVTSAVYL